MGELKETVTSCAKTLSFILNYVGDESQRSNFITSKCYERIKEKARLHNYLSQTISMFELRKNAWEILNSTVSSDSKIDERTLPPEEITPGRPKVRYCDSNYHFDVARHHSLIAYLSITWSIYDRLFNVYGRISSNDTIAKPATSNPKVSITLDKDKRQNCNFSGFNALEIIFDSYAWHIDVLLSLRNWLVHDGETTEFDGIKLFKSSTIDDGYILHDKAIRHFKKNNRGNPVELNDDDPWNYEKIDLLIVLEKYTQKVDVLFEKTLTWTIDSFENQVKLFALNSPV